MADRIYAVPDKNGVIPVKCGDTMIEVVVIPRADKGSAGGGWSVDPFDNAQALVWIGGQEPRQGLYFWDETYSLRPKSAGKMVPLDNESIVSMVEGELLDPKRADPRGVIVAGAASIDLHKAAPLSTKLLQMGPGVGLAFDFRLK